MTKTSLDVTTRALRMLGITGIGETPQAEEHADAKEVLQSLIEELQDEQGLAISWSAETVPDSLLNPMARLVASEIAPAYGKPGANRASAIARIRALLITDDRKLRADLDESGAMDDDEQDADLRSQYF